MTIEHSARTKIAEVAEVADEDQELTFSALGNDSFLMFSLRFPALRESRTEGILVVCQECNKNQYI